MKISWKSSSKFKRLTLSKFNFLLIILILVVTGFLLISQLKLATQSARVLTAAEIAEAINIRIDEAFRKLNRYPSSGAEFKQLVLDRLDFSRFPMEIRIRRFRPGNDGSPAQFHVVMRGETFTDSFGFLYYGSEFRGNISYNGKLVRGKSRRGKPVRE